MHPESLCVYLKQRAPQRLLVHFHKSFDRGGGRLTEAAFPPFPIMAEVDANLPPLTGAEAEVPPPEDTALPRSTRSSAAPPAPPPLRPPLSNCMMGDAATLVPSNSACLRFMAANSCCMQGRGAQGGERGV